MKKFTLALTLAALLSLAACGEPEPVEDDPGKLVDVTEKPLIYLYPETPTEVTVGLELDGELTCSYPAYRDGWRVSAEPDGMLRSGGREYYGLYWEGLAESDYSFDEGFCVSGADSAAFLESSLAQLGLTEREANEFIVYWLPRLERSPYNLVTFVGEDYTDAHRLEISPEPDTLIRVFMAFMPLDEAVEISPQKLDAPAREGFVAVEWGGCEIS